MTRLNQKITVYVEDDERAEDVELPTCIEICEYCHGEGTSSAYLGSFAGERLEEARADDEWWSDYMAGRFDRRCETCGGEGRVRVVDEDRCDPRLLELYNQVLIDRANDAAERRQMYLMEGGWREEEGYLAY